MLFRDMVKPANQHRAASAIANFILQHNLDGIDIDWEYPGAMDIPGIPQANASDGTNFSVFLGLLRTKLPEKTISIALPSGYWYLKGFPVLDIMQHVDYVVYMTYDYHGLWDYGNQWSQSGCGKGDCLRSHVNMSEILTSLALVTKAGVPSNKVAVGVASYGRGFHMVSSNCTGERCPWIHDATQPIGDCTQEQGLLANAELEKLSKQDSTIVMRDENSDSDVLVCPQMSWWIAYMSEETKQARMERYREMNFAGISDWAVDLQTTV